MKNMNRNKRALFITVVSQCCFALAARAGDVVGPTYNTFTTSDNSKDIVLGGGTPSFSVDLSTPETFLNDLHTIVGYAGVNNGDNGQVGLADIQYQSGPSDTQFGDAPAPYAMVGRRANGDIGSFVYKFKLGLGFTTGAGASVNASVYFRGTPSADGQNEYLGVNNSLTLSSNLVEITNAGDFSKLTAQDLFGNADFGTYTNTNASLAIPAGLNEFYVVVADAGSSGRFAIGSLTVNPAIVGTGDPTWAVNASGDWNSAGNWASGVPNGVGAKAILGDAISSPRTLYTDTPITLGSLKFDNPTSYQITGQGSLTIDAGAATGSIQVLQGNHKINLPTVVASDTTVDVNNGATLTIADPITISQNKTLTKNGTVYITAPLTLESGASLVSGSGALALFGAPSLGSNAKVDVKTNSMVVDYRGQADPAATIKSQLTSAYAGGAWTGDGITSSSTITGKTAVGWKDDASSQSIAVRYTYYGDADLDGAVTTSDFTALAAAFNGSGKVWSQGDFNYDGKVNALDFNALASNFGASPLAAPALGTLVPEPCSIGLLLLGAVSLRRIRRGGGL